MKKYIILHPSKDPNRLEHTNYVVDVEDNQDFDTVWESQKCWFTPSSVVTIQDLDGLEARTYTRE